MLRLRRSLWRLTLLGPLVALAVGCAGDSGQLDRALLADRNPAAHGGDLSVHYFVHSPDVLDVTIVGRPEWNGQYPIHADGRIAIGGVVFPRVDGHTVAEAAQIVAEHCGASPAQVHVLVVEYNSQHVYVISDAPGLQRVVAYEGPETIVDLLQRAGGVTEGGAPHNVQVVRSHVADGRSPEVFHVDLEAILLKQDQRTNMTLESFDQVYIGQTRGSCVWSCIPPWLRPFFSGVCGMKRG